MKNKLKKRVYFDHAATTPTDKRVISVMRPYLDKTSANPSALYEEGVEARRALSEAREKTARILQVRAEEIIFTSGGTESDNLAVQGVVLAARKSGIKNPHIITTAFEHSAILETCKFLENSGVSATYVKPEKNGIVSPEKIKKAINKNTILVSVMFAQNEIGTIQRIREIAKTINDLHPTITQPKFLRSKNLDEQVYPLFHTDACQAANYLNIFPNHLGVDLMTLTGSKIYGPKGSGILFVRHGTPISAIFHGGEQESGLRPGTEPVYLAAGFAEALNLTNKLKNEETKRLTKLSDYFISKLIALSPRITINGDPKRRLPNIVNISIAGIDNEFFVIQLDEAGISAATRSACKTNDESGSHVIISLGKSEKEAKESIRFSLGRTTTKKEIDYAIGVLKKLITNNL